MTAMRYTHTRADWVEPGFPVDGPAFDAARVDHAIIHYTAAPNLIDGDPGESWAGIAAYLRRIHRDYLMRTSDGDGVPFEDEDGYSIGYNAAVTQHGETWELRGVDFRSAAQPGRKFYAAWSPATRPNFNPRAFSVLMLVDGADRATPAALAAASDLIGQVEAHVDHALRIEPHSYTDYTECCGDGMRAQIAAGLFAPKIIAPPTPPPPNPIPPPPTKQERIVTPDDGIYLAAKLDSNGSFWLSDGSKRWHSDGKKRSELRVAAGVVDLTTERIVHNWSEVAAVSQWWIDTYMGPWDGARKIAG